MMTKKYNELIQFETFEDRFEYLKMQGDVGQETFGFDRYLNQKFYKSEEWKKVRNDVIVRDKGNDLGIKDREIKENIIVHHINPITPDDIKNKEPWILDPENLICVSLDTHNALHYGDASLLPSTDITIRKPNDTSPWK